MTDEYSAKRVVDSILESAKSIVETAKIADRGRQSLSGSGRYAARFHDHVVKLVTAEKALIGILTTFESFDLATFSKNIEVLRSTRSQVRDRDAALKNLRLLSEAEILPALQSLSLPAHPAHERVLPSEVVATAPMYVQKIVLQANGCYEQRWYDACSIMLRKIIESLIIEVYENHGKGDDIKKDGDFFMLSGLINHLLHVQKYWSLQRETKRELPELKKLGDRAAHNRRYQATRQDIDQVRSGLRVTVDDLLHLAGFK
jgi:hypothetical protein